jgi:hypothetical protein
MPLIEDALREMRDKRFKRLGERHWLREVQGGLGETGDERVIAAFPDELVAKLAAMIGVTAEGLAGGSFAFWARWALNEAPLPPPREISAELLALADALEEGARALDEADQRLFAVSPAAKEDLRALLPDFTDQRLELARRSDPIRNAARAAAREIKAPRGRPRRDDLYLLVDALAKVFEEATGRRAGRVHDWKSETDASVFPRFCRECIKPILGDPGSLTGIVREVAAGRRMAEKAPPPPD